MMEHKITVLAEDNSPIEVFVIDSLVLRGDTYVLVSEQDPETGDETEEIETVLLKKTSETEDHHAYSPVEDDKEYDVIIDLFMQNDAYDIEL